MTNKTNGMRHIVSPIAPLLGLKPACTVSTRTPDDCVHLIIVERVDGGFVARSNVDRGAVHDTVDAALASYVETAKRSYARYGENHSPFVDWMNTALLPNLEASIGGIADEMCAYFDNWLNADGDDFPRCPQCGDPIDYCQGHGELNG